MMIGCGMGIEMDGHGEWIFKVIRVCVGRGE